MGSVLARDPAAPATSVARGVRPVMLLTLNVPFEGAAVEFAIDAAAETGAELYVCDAMPVAANYIAHAARQWAERDNLPHVAAVVEQARARAVRVTRMGFHNPKPIAAALEVSREQSIGLLVFGADRARLGRWTYRRAVKRLRKDATCLLWVGD